METITRFRRVFVTAKYCTMTRDRSLDRKFPVLKLRMPKELTKIPDMDVWWTKFLGLQMAQNNFKRELLNELIEECNINQSSENLHYFEKVFIVRSSIESLIQQNFVSSLNSLLDTLLSHLEPFPFDDTKISENGNNLLLRDIRNEIEKQYLAWKYEFDVKDIGNILHRYRLCLYEFRSMRNLKRNIANLEKLPSTRKFSIAEKIYHINQTPFHARSAANFQQIIAGLNWQLFPQYCPKILRHSQQYILFVISILQSLGFSEKQITEGFPFLHLTFQNFIKRLNYMLGHREMVNYRDEDKFLHLLSYQLHVLCDLVDLRKASFVELTDMITISSKNLTPRVKFLQLSSILFHVNQFFKVSGDCANTLKRHPKYRISSEQHIFDTLNLLKSENFKDSEVEESITLVLYPRDFVVKTLEKIRSEKEALQKYGFKNGFLTKETNFFQNGTKEKRKILQLCLYYLEKPCNFSGDGIWDSKYQPDTVTS